MENFTYHVPTTIVFGTQTISSLTKLIDPASRVLLLYGGGSIMENGVYNQVRDALMDCQVSVFGGIEPNPRFETLMRAVEQARGENSNFLLAVGGGSVLDGTKFVAAAIPFQAGHEWDILAKGSPVTKAVPFGCVLTLPATGSEMNPTAVISRASTEEKLVFSTPLVYPRFSILDPTVTYSLPPVQTANGVVDAFIHVAEQYFTYPVHAPLQDRQAEAIFLTLIEEGPKALAHPENYDVRANIMWCATQALNGLIACGVPQDWTTHMIGHELTALYGIDHAQTLAIVLPAVLRHEKKRKSAKILQFASRVWGITEGSDDVRIEKAIEHMVAFFASLGMKPSLSSLGVDRSRLHDVGEKIDARKMRLGEHQDITGKTVNAILDACW